MHWTHVAVTVALLAAPALAAEPPKSLPATAPVPAAVPPAQQQWLDAVLAADPRQAAPKEPLAQLRAAVGEPANEALAVRVAEAARENPLHRAILLDLLDQRVGTTARPGVGGPYLKAYANLLLDVLDGRVQAVPADAPPRARWSEAAKGNVLLAYLRLHPEDKETRQRLVVLAKPCGRVSDLPRANRLSRGGRGWTVTRCGLDIRTVWSILVQCGVLSDGMKLADALHVLGQPTGEHFSRGGETNHIRWQYDWNLRLAPPAISAELKDGKLTTFRVTR